MTNNASSTIAALKTVLETYGKKEEMLKTIPPIPLRYIEIKDTLNPTLAPVLKRTISPAVSWERINNVETPQLYPVFPWRIYGVGKENLDIARNTYFMIRMPSNSVRISDGNRTIFGRLAWE